MLLTGASGGLGGAIARLLRREGADLILSGRRVEALETLAHELGARAVAADLTRAEEVERLADAAKDADILVANAALPAAAPLQKLTIEEVDRALDVNLRAPIVLAHALLPRMIERRRGHLVFISSTGGKAAAAGNPLYHATKFGLRGFAGGLRIDLHDAGVGVSCVLPGFISEAGLFAESGVRLPFGVGTRAPEDVARAVAQAIERDRAEVQVAAPFLRGGTLLWNLAPDLASAVARRLGAGQIAQTYERALQDKR